MGGYRKSLTHAPQYSKHVKEGVGDLISLFEEFKQTTPVMGMDGDQGENPQRSELSRCARKSLTTLALVDILPSSLEEIEKRFRALLEKGAVARFMDGAGDSVEAVKLVERFQEVIRAHHQVSENCLVPSATHTGGQTSQQQEIHDQITNPTVNILQPIPSSIPTN